MRSKLDPFVARRPFFQDRGDFGTIRGICDAEFPLVISLCHHGREHLFQENSRRVVDRGKQTDFRPVRDLLGKLSLLFAPVFGT